MIDPQKPDYSNIPGSDMRPRFDYRPAEARTRPAVTIITPYRDTGPLFHQTALTVLGQSFQEWEWLIVNDGSKDPEALSVLADYRQRDPRIRVIDRPSHLGPSAARNTGFEAASTGYVVQLDSDDLLEPTAVEKWLWHLTSYPEYGFVNSYSVGFGAKEYLWSLGFEAGRTFLLRNMVPPTAMIQKAVHQDVGGYDESNLAGLEDWDFWLNCASKGHWGGSVPEYLHWYRRRPFHEDRWSNWDEGERQQAFLNQLKKKYPRLWRGGFPRVEPRGHVSFGSVADDLPCSNILAKDRPRLLVILPWLAMGGADKFNLELVEHLTGRGYQVSICTTGDEPSPWSPLFARFTPDIFFLPNFLRPADYPRFLRYLIESRRIDVVFISHSALGYRLLPYLRSRCQGVAFVDFNHLREECWQNGGHPRSGVGYQELLDLNIVSNRGLKDWMVSRGADGRRIATCYTNIDPKRWDRDRNDRDTVRRRLGLSEDLPLILFAGRLCHQKRPRLLADVMRVLVGQGLEFRCLVAGGGEMLGFLKMYVRWHGLGRRVSLLGPVSLERMRELMAAADIFFLPSGWEGIAMTLFEAMASRTVPVAADVGGQGELVTSECGFLIPRGQGELKDYVSALRRLMVSPELRQAMGRAGRRRIEEHFTIDRMAERMVELLGRAQESARISPRPVVGRGLGLECATLAVEYNCLESFAGRWWNLWNMHPLAGKLARLVRLDAKTLVHIYWTCHALFGADRPRSLAARILGVNRVGK